MAKAGANPVERQSVDLVKENIARLKELFPEAVSEGKVDFEKLKATLGEIVDDKPERYSFTWAGKRDAIRLLQVPSRATLKPCSEQSVNWDTTKNLFIEGENLEVLKLLYKSYAGRVKMIYIDPPYNTGNDFIYPDDFTDPLENYLMMTAQKDGEGNLLTSNPETSGRYHSAGLSMMYPRLFVARQLLREDGLIFISADDSEVHNLRIIMNEVFGEENFLACIAWEKRFTRSNNAKLFYSLKDSIIVYRRSAIVDALREQRTEKSDSIYKNPDGDPRGPWTSSSYVNPATKAERPNLVYPIHNPHTGMNVEHPTHAWKYEKAEHERHVAHGLLWWGRNGEAKYPRLKNFLSDAEEAGLVPIDVWYHKDTGTTDEGGQQLKAVFDGRSVFDNPKPTRLIRRMMELSMGGDESDLILDFFAGSGGTAQAVLEFNREMGASHRFILVQLPEPANETTTALAEGFPTIAEVCKERIRRAISAQEKQANGQLDFDERISPEDLGFRVFALTESAYRQWHGTEERDGQKYSDEMELFTDPLLAGWKPDDVIWEVALKEGYSLSSTVEALDAVKGNQVFRVTDPDREQSFCICLDDKLHDKTAEALAFGKEDLFVCRDAALTDEQAANLALQCKLKTI